MITAIYRLSCEKLKRGGNKMMLKKLKKSALLLFVFSLLFSVTIISVLAFSNTINTAVTISWYNSNNYQAGVTDCIDDTYQNHYYKINIEDTGPYSIYLTGNNQLSSTPYEALPADYDLVLYNPSKVSIVSSCASSTTPEYITFEVGGTNPTGWYYIRVYSTSSYVYDEEYRLTIAHGDTKMFVEGMRYCNCPWSAWYCRSSYTDNIGYLITRGVAYSYGNKNSFAYFKTKLQEAIANASIPLTGWNKYSASYKRPGMFKYEYDNQPYNEKYVTDYIGIDCSGLIQRAAMASNSNDIYRYYISRAKNLTDSGANAFASFGNGEYDVTVVGGVETGDIVKMPGHYAMISRPNKYNNVNSYVMAAESESIDGGRKVKEYILYNKHPNTNLYYRLIP